VATAENFPGQGTGRQNINSGSVTPPPTVRIAKKTTKFKLTNQLPN